jgi:hydroxymethylpyrimidine pyrophosphatase-like HAD family hydrolase
MHYKVLACDLDGTLATEGVVAPATWAALRRARRRGLALFLVTGRSLQTFADEGPFDELFEAIVAEDGAALYYPRTESTVLPFGRVDPEIAARLRERDVPIEQGIAIVATWTPHDEAVHDVLRETGGGASVEYNRGAVMVLPPGATKGTGLLTALRTCGYSPRNVVAVGDAENDRSLFEVAELSVAVANAAPEIQALADVVLPEANGAGVRGLIEDLLAGRVPSHRVRPERELVLGHRPGGEAVRLPPSAVLDHNVGIVGASASGKSWIAGLLAEELLRLGYQICVIDPEGDYGGLRSYPHTLVIGGADVALPSVPDVVALCEYTEISLIVDLSMFGVDEQIAYTQGLLHALLNLRARRGRPHWFLVDEVHSFCPEEGTVMASLLAAGLRQGGFAVVSYRPTLAAEAVVGAIDHWIVTRLSFPEEREGFQVLADRPCFHGATDALAALPLGQAFLGFSEGEGVPAPGPVAFRASQRTVPHVRHLNKYLRAPLPGQKRFFFRPLKGEVPAPAASLWDFRETLATLPTETVAYHLRRGDFERWVRDVMRDAELARRLRKITHRPLTDPELRRAVADAVADRYEELDALI